MCAGSIEQLETQRVFYEEELSNIGHQYQVEPASCPTWSPEQGCSTQVLLDKLSFVITDYSVRTAPIQVLLCKPMPMQPGPPSLLYLHDQVRVGGGYELLSTYLNRIFEDQSKLKDQ